MNATKRKKYATNLIQKLAIIGINNIESMIGGAVMINMNLKQVGIQVMEDKVLSSFMSIISGLIMFKEVKMNNVGIFDSEEVALVMVKKTLMRQVPIGLEKPLTQICEGCLWIGDSGASSHMTNILKGFAFMQEDNTHTTFGAAGDGLESEGRGIWRG